MFIICIIINIIINVIIIIIITETLKLFFLFKNKEEELVM